MYYRYEFKDKMTEEWTGIFRLFNPSQRRYIARTLHVPVWYKNHPGIDSRCWFTEYGYEKYKNDINKFIATYNVETRILKADNLNNLAVKGKIQCIERLEEF